MIGLIHLLMTNPQTTEALWLGSLIAAVSAVTGVFVILRGQAFVGHVLTDIGVTGAAGAYLLGLSGWYGFLTFGIVSGETVEVLGDRAQNRDIATGIVLSMAMGLGALFLYLDARVTGNASAAQLVVFGSLFAVEPAIQKAVMVASFVALIVIVVLYRPLLLSSISLEVARAKGIPVRLISLLYMLSLAIAVEDSALVVGALMSTALLIGPAYTATKLSRKPHLAIIIAVVIAVITMILGVSLANISAYWPPVGQGWPVSFFISVLVIIPAIIAQRWQNRQQGRQMYERKGAVS